MDKVRFGIVGLGNMGAFHARSFKDIQDATLAAVCDVAGEQLEKIAIETGATPFTSYQKMLESGTIDAVLVAVPHYFHGEITRSAWAKGIHVLCEKPLCVSINEARQVVETYKKYPKLKFGIMF